MGVLAALTPLLPTTDDPFNVPDDVLAFVGVASTLAFNRLEITELTATIDDEFYGEFYSSATPAAVPEPTTLALLSMGLIGFGTRRLRRKDQGGQSK